MGFESGRDEILRLLRDGTFQEEIQREVGGSINLQSPEVLLSELRKYQARSQADNATLESQETPEEQLRGMRRDSEIGGASLRSESGEQHPGELADALLLVPQFLARYGKEAWEEGRWENGIARVATGVSARVDRLKAIGNGQVPAVAALAWQVLK